MRRSFCTNVNILAIFSVIVAPKIERRNSVSIKFYSLKQLRACVHLPSKIFCSTGPAPLAHKSQRYLRMYFVDSVLPAPDSPDTIIDCDCFRDFMSRNALSAVKHNSR